jgi:hypothetical protein
MKRYAAVLVLALAGSLALGYFSGGMASATKTTAVTGRNFNTNTSAGLIVNTTLSNNSLYGNSSMYNPHTIFRNITKKLNFYLYYEYNSTGKVKVNTEFEIMQTLYSSTVPSYTKVLNSSFISFTFNGTQASRWIQIPVNITESLLFAEQVNKQLNIVPAAPSLVINMTGLSEIDNKVTTMNASLNLSFNYENYQTVYFNQLTNYDYIINGGNHYWHSSALINNDSVVPLPNYKVMFESVSLVSYAAFVLCAAVMISMFIPERKEKLAKFIADNKEDIVKVNSPPAITGNDFSVRSLEELLRITMVSGRPLLMFEGDDYTILYLKTDESGYYMKFRTIHSEVKNRVTI